MASSSPELSLVDLQIIKFPFSARLISMQASGLHGVVIGYTRPGPASSSVFAPRPAPPVLVPYVRMPLMSDPFNRIYSFLSVNIGTLYSSKAKDA